MKKIFPLLFVLLSVFCVSCKKGERDIVLREDSVMLPASHYHGGMFSTMLAPDWKSIELVALSEGNEMNFLVSRVPFTLFIGHDAEEYDDILTEELMKKYKIKDSAVNKSKNYYFCLNRKKDDDVAALDTFVLYFEDTSWGILSESSSEVSFKIIAHR